MRRAALSLLPLAIAAFALTAPVQGQTTHARDSQRQTAAPRPAAPPHAWLFGAWTGGLFPVLEGMLAQDCRTQPTVVFSQDVVGHGSLTGPALTRRIIETVRTTPAGAEFRFSPDPQDNASFGCEDSTVLHVARADAQTISFPHCAAFPYPLQRCPTPAG